MTPTRWDHITDIAVRDMMILNDMMYEDRWAKEDLRYEQRMDATDCGSSRDKAQDIEDNEGGP